MERWRGVRDPIPGGSPPGDPECRRRASGDRRRLTELPGPNTPPPFRTVSAPLSRRNNAGARRPQRRVPVVFLAPRGSALLNCAVILSPESAGAKSHPERSEGSVAGIRRLNRDRSRLGASFPQPVLEMWTTQIPVIPSLPAQAGGARNLTHGNLAAPKMA
jgi:hypothetical protein